MKSALVLEGGAMRGLFTAGVILNQNNVDESFVTVYVSVKMRSIVVFGP